MRRLLAWDRAVGRFSAGQEHHLVVVDVPGTATLGTLYLALASHNTAHAFATVEYVQMSIVALLGLRVDHAGPPDPSGSPIHQLA
jgi:hypothetical protein